MKGDPHPSCPHLGQRGSREGRVWRSLPGRVRSQVPFLGLVCASGKEPACQCRRHRSHGFDPWVRKILWRRAWQPTPVFLPGESHGQRSLVGYSPWDHKEITLLK